MKKIWMLPINLFVFLFGKIIWTAPPWLVTINRLKKNKPIIFYGMILSVLFSIATFQYYQSLPKSITVRAEIRPLGFTPNIENAKPDNLNIHFVYDLSRLNEDQERPQGYPSIARIDLLGQEVNQGINLSPSKKGKWIWSDDRQLSFIPETDWPAGTQYEVKFESSIFVKEAKLSDHSYLFSTPSFLASIDDTEFYQDPLDIKTRRVISTIRFSHPVNKESLMKNLNMNMRPSGLTIDKSSNPYHFEINYDKNLREAYIQSQPIELPKKPNYMKISLNAGVKGIFGGNASSNPIQEKILIPDIYSFLKVSTAQTQIVRNKKDAPEQVLMLEFTDDIEEKELLSKLQVYLLPKKGEANGKGYWQGPREVSPKILANREKLDLKVISNRESFSKFYSFIFNVPENRSLYVKINKGLTSVNRFIQSSFYDAVLSSPSYPKEVTIAGDGALLTYSGEHKLSVLSRGVPALRYSIGRLLDGQLFHLISQTGGDINRADFSAWAFSAENVAEFKREVVNMVNLHPKQSNYASIDLGKFLPKNDKRLGLFFVKVEGWDRKNNQRIYGVEDERLVLITNLGVIVKNNADRSHDIFVQSIKTGEPVTGATVELLGKNGIALLSKTTSVKGQVQFPSTRDYLAEQQPTVWVVKTKEDTSFIPFDRYSRQINLSRFNIGGVDLRGMRTPLNAYLFSDRGIYRPGEKINIGTIVKNFDFSNVQDIPLELVIRGPRNNEMKVKKIKLAELGFFDFQYQTESTSDTGRYSVSLHLVRNNKYRGREIGSVNFKLEEFQPDTMKIESELVDINAVGWADNNNVQVKVSLKNLFGLPAQNRDLTGRVIIKPTKFVFKQYKNYQFTDPFTNNKSRSMNLDRRLKTQKTDAEGAAVFDIDLQQFKQGSYSLHFTAEGFEPGGGRSVISNNTTLISPMTELVGYKTDGKLKYINKNTQRNIDFIVIDKSLNQTSKSGLEFRLIRVQHISTLVKQHNNTYKYQTVKKESEISAKPLKIQIEGYKYTIDSKHPGDYAIEIVDSQDRRLSRLEYSIVGNANLAGKLDKSLELQLKLNKSDYLPGELIEMNIKAPYAGAGLISIENDKVRHFKWFKTTTQSSMQTIRLPENLEGTGYINVTFVRDITSKKIFTSPLSYAVQPFSIDKNKRKIQVNIEVDDIVRPGKAMEIKYTVSKKSKIIIFAIDEGILQVAKYRSPDPLGHFLKKRALGVETMQILDLILPEFALLKSLSASGGDMATRRLLAKNVNPFSRKTDKPAVFWSGILPAGTVSDSVSFDIPGTFAGSLRVMAVAVAEDSVGIAQQSTLVRGPFVISPKVLTQVAPEDEFMVTVGVSNIVEGSGKGAMLNIKVAASEHLTLLDSSSTQLNIAEGSEGQFSFRVKATKIIGSAELKFTVSLNNEVATRTAGLSVRPAMPYFNSFESGFEKSGKVELAIKRQLYPDLAIQKLSASASPLVLVDGLTSYLDSYPHGCTEQVVSKVFPLVGLMTHPSYAPHVKDIDIHFSHLIDKLRERQLANGGFAFWPGQQIVAEYPSIYVMHFLIESISLGYPVPQDMLNRGQSYLSNYAEKSSTTIIQARNRANAIYLLTRLGVVTTNYLVDLEEELNKQALENKQAKRWQKDLLASYMAATYKLLQNDAQAEKLVAEYTLGKSGSLGSNSNAPSNSTTDDFHSPLSQDAQYIYLLSKHFESRAKALSGGNLLQLTSKIFKGEYNTISSAYSILALGAYSQLVLKGQYNENKITFASWVQENNKKTLRTLLDPFVSATYPVASEGLLVDSDRPIYFLNRQSGFDTQLPTEATRKGIEIQRAFLDDEGNEVTSFEQGQEIAVRLRVRALNNEQLTNVAVIDLLPGGFEVIRSSVSRTAYNWRADYVDIREDRVVYYGDFDTSIRELTYKVKLTAAGTFVIPPSYVESMYDRSIRGISKAGTFIVTQQNTPEPPNRSVSDAK